ncbi:PfkB family carbohydrate kinase [Paenibacillus alkaliterrae]|uniref:carbohydrate kinase family protein n=1 Tax=Paenibacillus alkaliterrae TaxID=320909 RepID=UPI001F2AD642|nr:PfkB family carbohydrate kinase [Paenibacillus alkaliterrae]MCF2941632.1 PfkB family carbohydrate kinase [Paenibacillus alkaliterrae]
MSEEVVLAGHIALDILPAIQEGVSFKDFFVPGRLQQVGPAHLATGGCVLNTGLALHKLGMKTRMMGKVGNDEFGQSILNLIRREGPSLTQYIRVDPESQSSYTLALNIPGYDRVLLNFPGINDTFHAEDIEPDSLSGARLFHFGYPPLMKRMIDNDGEELVTLMKTAKSKGLITSLDMSMPGSTSDVTKVDWRKLMTRTLPHVDIFLPSIEEILFMFEPETYQKLLKESENEEIIGLITSDIISRVADQILALGSTVAVIKVGHKGLYLKTSSRKLLGNEWIKRELWAPCYKTKVVGTTGSGDCTIAGFLAGILKQLPPDQVLNSAVAVGACSVESNDATGAIVPWEQVQQRIRSGWERLNLQDRPGGFIWSDNLQLWAGSNEQER